MSKNDRANPGEYIPSRAIIDIGSNTVRLVVYGGPPRAPTVLLNEKVTAKLGKGVAETGRLSPKATKATLAALTRYHMLIKLLDVPQVDVVATAAVRDASNGGAFLNRIRDIGFSPRLLSGEEEAVTSAQGVIGAFPWAQGIVADLGGGSLELVDVVGDRCTHGVSLPLGTLRLPALRAAGQRAFATHVTEVIAGAEWSATPGETLYLVGGSFRSLARYTMQQRNWPSDDPHGFHINAAEALKLARSLSRKRTEPLAPVKGISSSRMASLPATAALLEVLVKTLSPAELVFSAWGLREGLLFSGLEPAQRAQDPLLASVSAFVEHYGTSAARATMVAGWCSPAQVADTASASGERLRMATAMLALAAANLEANLRTDFAIEWAMRKRWIGLRMEDRVMLAAGLLANAGQREVPDQWRSYVSADNLHEAQGWGLAVRLCRRFSGNSARSLSNSMLRVADGALWLFVRDPFQALVNAGVERDLKELASHFGLRPELQVVADGESLRA